MGKTQGWHASSNGRVPKTNHQRANEKNARQSPGRAQVGDQGGVEQVASMGQQGHGQSGIVRTQFR